MDLNYKGEGGIPGLYQLYSADSYQSWVKSPLATVHGVVFDSIAFDTRCAAVTVYVTTECLVVFFPQFLANNGDLSMTVLRAIEIANGVDMVSQLVLIGKGGRKRGSSSRESREG